MNQPEKKINKTKIRRDISLGLAKKFIESGAKYDCAAAVHVLRPEALIEAKKLLDNGINLSKSNYPFAFAGLMADMFLGDVVNLVHEHYYPKKKLNSPST